MLARAGRISDQVIAAVERETLEAGLDANEAVVGGLLVRMNKLLCGVFDATQADESEAHAPLSRCAVESAVTLRWLVFHGKEKWFRRFRADSFAYWRTQLASMQSRASDHDPTVAQLSAHIEKELRGAGLTWEDVPKAPNSWGPDMRQRCVALGQEWIYTSFFASHHNYVHPSWHELSALHLTFDDERFRLAPSFAGIPPITSYVLARVVCEAAGYAASFLRHDLDPEDLRERVAKTVEASQLLAGEFSDYFARGGFEQSLSRDEPPPASPPSDSDV